MFEAGYDKVAMTRDGGGGYMGALMALLATKREGKELWAVLIFIVFVIIILIVIAVMFSRDGRRHDGVGMEAIAPVLAASMVAKQPYHDGGHYGGYSHDAYDFAKFAKLESHSEHLMQIRDTLEGQGMIKEKLAEKTTYLSDKIAQNHYDALLEIRTGQEKTAAEIAAVKQLINDKEERKMAAEIAYLRQRDMFHGFHGNKATINVQDIGVGGGYGYGY